MLPAHASLAVWNVASDASAPGVTAVQDRDCIDRAKFRYDLASPLPKAFFDQFADAKITLREFSKMMPLGRDLFSIAKPGSFRADGLVGETKMTVAFDGDPQYWPWGLIENFERRLQAVGYGDIRYVAGTAPDCGRCPARFEKKCRGLHSHST